MNKVIAIISVFFLLFGIRSGFAEEIYQSVSTDDAAFVLFRGKVHLIPAAAITGKDIKCEEKFALWLQDHNTKTIKPYKGKNFTGVLAKSHKLGIIVNDKATLLYDYTIEYNEVLLSNKKVARQALKQL